ncbi:hypothetical protein [Mariniblastus fucicola]|uniref:Uncharacterized protein n=1 Tax=Mariniblastus fucicola TaxID=980251 RepID=A0A5B9PR35_9BACT|nr:hypothetical protein [Mariniblastus fucicola]QEG24783.1 hypothetical protein MFFC18_47060 [Mariniblastus fucicola]
MTQEQLEQEISQQTGEHVGTIRRLGFSPLQEIIPLEERQTPLVVDWDLLDSTRKSGPTLLPRYL